MMPIVICNDQEPEVPRADKIRACIELRQKVIDKIKKELPVLNRTIATYRSPRKIRMARALHKSRSDKLIDLQARNKRLQSLLKELENESLR